MGFPKLIWAHVHGEAQFFPSACVYVWRWEEQAVIWGLHLTLGSRWFHTDKENFLYCIPNFMIL